LASFDLNLVIILAAAAVETMKQEVAAAVCQISLMMLSIVVDHGWLRCLPNTPFDGVWGGKKVKSTQRDRGYAQIQTRSLTVN